MIPISAIASDRFVIRGRDTYMIYYIPAIQSTADILEFSLEL